ncbi:hypothetical protein IEQ34_002268 [Dendrobium chrysotoxum]|uniref:1-phosphatidylinositol 4-kinase n=1 Tax=Dendrobium chrysotoxum TaxID=161865 RepID=A0AAV7HJ13_DENCH|nr:hypothetical protein IEQ34_002268 [Dendrobium chrysotoxum]
MAVTVGCHHLPGGGSGSGFKPSGLIHGCHFCSFHHPDLLSVPPTSLFQRSHSTPCLLSSASTDDDVASVMIVGGGSAPGIHALVAEAAATMAFGACPVPSGTGLGSAYFLEDQSGDCVAVVKPVVIDDNEQLAFPSSSIRACETGAREAAAYLLDHGTFAGVPPTALIRISHHSFPPARCVASIQRFVPHDCDAGDVGPSRFSVSSVHRIAILDIRLLNTDRHAGNLLVKKHRIDNNRSFEGGDITTELVPIDHGLCLPELLDDPYFEWLHWPQAAVPFSDQVTEYVSKLDPFKDAELLRTELPSIREPAIRILILCTIFLKKAVDYGLCLSEIGRMMTRESYRLEAGESVLETLCKKTEETIEAESQLSDNDEVDFGEGDERKECQFAMDCGDEDKLRIPLLLSKKSLDPLQEEEKEERGKGMMMKSLSFSARELNCDGERVQRSKMISFKSKSEEEWKLFLERFEQLLPEAFEARKRMKMKLRLGSSC